MSKNRVYDLARRLNVPSRELIDFLKVRGIEVKSHMSTVDEKTSDLILKSLGKEETAEPEKKDENAAREKKASARTYIPPRRRKRRRYEPVKPPVRGEAPVNNRQQLQEPVREEKHEAKEPSSRPEEKRKKVVPERRAMSPEAKSQVTPRPKAPSVEGKEKITPPPRRVSRGKEQETASEPQKPSVEGQKRSQKPKMPLDRKRRQEGRTGKIEKAPSQYTRPSSSRTGRPVPPRSGRPAPGQTKEQKPQLDSDSGQETPQAPRRPSVRRHRKVRDGEPTRGTVRRQDARHIPRVEAEKAEKKTGKTPQAKPEETARSEKAFDRRRPTRGKGERTVGKKREVRQKETVASQKPVSRPPRKAKKKAVLTTVPEKVEQRVPVLVPTPPEPEVPTHLEIPEVIMVKQLAEKMSMPPAKIVQHLMTMGIMANVNQVLETKAAMSIAEHFGFEAKSVPADEEVELQEEIVDESKLKPRPPVVTIMGHVDHGKTTLLDAIRESKVAESEFGGITQHIGAYAVEIREQRIVFLDTPGHEAFTAMRARGAKVTDEVVLVVAADDGIMPQTIEAIDHARAAQVPIIVAINKMDVPGANPDRVMQELTKYGLTPEDWGGETICVKVSAKQRTNLDELLEMILLQAEMLELKADPDRPAKGVIVEALLDKGRGPVATVLVHSGTLRIGDPFVVGQYHGKVRAMLDDRGKRIKQVGPATPVEVLGLTGVPVAGDSFLAIKTEREARQIAESRKEQQQRMEFSKTAKITLEELHHHIKEGETQELRIVIKADVHGSVEALNDALERLATEQVRLQVIHGGVGAINESDVMLATASNAIVLGFNVRPVAKAQEMAEKEQIDVRLYTVIYQAIDDIKKAMEGLLKPRYEEELIGQAQVQALFNLPKGGKVAGCRVTDGKITRNAIVRVLREKNEVFKGKIASLRRVKDDVREVLTGYECGIRLEGYNDVQDGDIIEAYTLKKLIMTLEQAAAQQR